MQDVNLRIEILKKEEKIVRNLSYLKNLTL